MRRHIKKAGLGILAAAVCVTTVAVGVSQFGSQDKTAVVEEKVSATNDIVMHFKWTGDATPHLYYSNVNNAGGTNMSYPGVPMNAEGNGWYSYTISEVDSADLIISVPEVDYQTNSFGRNSGEYWYDEGRGWFSENPDGEKKTEKKDNAKEEGLIEVVSDASEVAASDGITVHFMSDWENASIYYWNAMPNDMTTSWPGDKMTKDENGDYTYTFEGASKINLLFTDGSQQTADLTVKSGEWWYNGKKWSNKRPDKTVIVPSSKGDFRDETIYFVMTTRFYDGDPSNNVFCWGDNPTDKANNDPGWRGDFKGLAEKLDYIKALGFSAIWITPVVQNASGVDYHGYHASNFKKVDSRYESSDYTYQDLINDAHAKGIKVIQDIVLNHTSNFGEENLYPLLIRDNSADLSSAEDCLKVSEEAIAKGIMPSQSEYDAAIPDDQYGYRLKALKSDDKDKEFIYHHEEKMEWEQYIVQTGSIAGDCVDLNTENKIVSDYLIDAYNGYIDMGVDSFRIDTVKHISRLSFNKEFIPAFKEHGGDNFYIFGECCCLVADKLNKGIPCITSFFYTWKENKEYPWGTREEREKSVFQNWEDNSSENANSVRKSDNAFLKNDNEYHEPDNSIRSGLDVIDFRMHHNFESAYSAFGSAGENEDDVYSDATWNVTYVDSHDYGPNCSLQQRYNKGEAAWAENLDLMFTFRGIPCIYYGSEIEFMAGEFCDPHFNSNTKRPYEPSGRAYFGDHIEGDVSVPDYGVYSGATGELANTLNSPLSKHLQRLNLIRRAVPALRKGQYSTKNVTGDGISYRRRYTSDSEDSYVLVNLFGQATFSNVLNG